MELISHLEQNDLQQYVKKILGDEYSVATVTKMHGGAQKVVYRIDCTNGFTCILYVWDMAMNYFKEEIERDTSGERSYGGDLFELNSKYLGQQGIQAPTLYDLNKDRDRYAFDYALVEFINGKKAEDFFRHPDARVQDTVFERIGDMLAKMHAAERETYGKSNQTEIHPDPCHLLQLENAKEQLAYAAQYVHSISVNQDRLLAALYDLESQIAPRKRYAFIHGELGPDHILVNADLEPYLIDIEGAGFFDIEHEHSFLEFRFQEYYRYLKNEELDPNRMQFYRLHHHISLISGGLKLLHRGFPDQSFAKGIADHHTRCAMQFIRE